MVLMCGVRIFVARVTFEADSITRKPQLGAVWVVAIATGDARGEHLALLERAVIIDLVEHLTVGRIKPSAKECYGMRVGEPLAGDPILRELTAACVAQPAGLNLLAQPGWRYATLGLAAFRVVVPSHPVSFAEPHQKIHICVVSPAEWPPASLVARPGDMV
jgi:hypothetical protein